MPTTQTATLGGGCFWCLEAVYLELSGVLSVKSGYAGGHVANPTYEQVCAKTTGHAEVVQVQFDPAIVSYDDLLRIFFTIHDPTTLDRQGNDAGPQYRSIIMPHNAAQAEAATRIMAEVEAANIWGAPIVTEIKPLDTFWPAEAEHDDYFNRTPWSGYCRVVIAPKVAKFRKYHADRLKRPAA